MWAPRCGRTRNGYASVITPIWNSHSSSNDWPYFAKMTSAGLCFERQNWRIIANSSPERSTNAQPPSSTAKGMRPSTSGSKYGSADNVWGVVSKRMPPQELRFSALAFAIYPTVKQATKAIANVETDGVRALLLRSLRHRALAFALHQKSAQRVRKPLH